MNFKKNISMIFIIVVCFYKSAKSEEIKISSDLISSFETNDNISMSNQSEQSIAGYKVSIPSKTQLSNENFELIILSGITFADFNNNVFNSNDANISGYLTKESLEYTLKFSAGYKIDSTRDTDFIVNGIVGAQANRRRTNFLNAEYFYTFSERIKFSFTYNKDRQDNEADLRNDISINEAESAIDYRMKKNSNLKAKLSYQSYESYKNTNLSGRSTEFVTLIDFNSTETSIIKLAVGIVNNNIRIKDSNLVADSTINNNYFTFDLESRIDFSTKKLTLNVYKKQQYNSINVIVRTEAVMAKFTQLMGEKLSIGTNVVLGTNNSIVQELDNERKFRQFQPYLEYKISNKMLVTLRYSYNSQRFKFASNNSYTDSNAVSLNIKYKFDEISL